MNLVKERTRFERALVAVDERLDRLADEQRREDSQPVARVDGDEEGLFGGYGKFNQLSGRHGGRSVVARPHPAGECHARSPQPP